MQKQTLLTERDVSDFNHFANSVNVKTKVSSPLGYTLKQKYHEDILIEGTYDRKRLELLQVILVSERNTLLLVSDEADFMAYTTATKQPV
jgi:hypothetical protein